MKRCLRLLVVVLAGALVVTGCARKNKVNTAKLEKSFRSADPKNKEYSDQVVPRCFTRRTMNGIEPPSNN